MDGTGLLNPCKDTRWWEGGVYLDEVDMPMSGGIICALAEVLWPGTVPATLEARVQKACDCPLGPPSPPTARTFGRGVA